MIFNEKKIYELLPAIYRIRDAENNGSLKALMSIIAGQAVAAEADIEKLYRNWFIETCEEWVVPYIGDLLGVRNLHNVSGHSVISQRVYVANTISYRRRKGIAPVLEQLSLDIAGWRAHATEFFELLAASQFMNHIRLHRTLTPDLRKMNQLSLLNTGFDTIAHSADVRNISSGRGLYNIPNLGLFIWRLQNYRVDRSDAKRLTCKVSPDPGVTHFFTFDPAGFNCQLFNSPETETTITHVSEEINVPGLLRRQALSDELEERRKAIVAGETISYRYFDNRQVAEDDAGTKKHPVFEIYKNNDQEPVPPEEILICNLEECCTPIKKLIYKKPLNDGTFTDVEFPVTVAVDPVTGRFVFTDPFIKKAKVSYSYGFSGDTGAGTYDRQESVDTFLNQKIDWQVGVSKNITNVGGEVIYTKIQDAIDKWNDEPNGKTGIIVIMDSCSYSENLTIHVKEKSRLLIVAANWPDREKQDASGVKTRLTGDLAADGIRPFISGNITIHGIIESEEASAESENSVGSLWLNGLLVDGKILIPNESIITSSPPEITTNNLGALNLDHCTFIPEKSSIEVGGDISSPLSESSANQWARIELRRTICGAVKFYNTEAQLFYTEDCIIDHSTGFAVSASRVPSEFKGTTFFGKIHVKTLHAENCIFNESIKVERRQEGCIRFSFVPGKNPETPRRYRCQPELEIALQLAKAEKSKPVSDVKKELMDKSIREWLVPGYTSSKYGNHAYAQLSSDCPVQILKGADNSSEMGVFCFLQQSQRKANLHIALDEYLPFGLEAGIIYVT